MENAQTYICDPRKVILHFYPDDSPLRELLIRHSTQVRDKAFEILRHSGLQLDRTIIESGAMLHDIGIGRCHAPGIFCHGTSPYIMHGTLGAAMLRSFAAEHNCDLEPFARIAERHTGSGLTAQEIRRQNLPLPEQDFLPETPEEKLICLADKFYSKSGDLQEKSLSEIRRGMAKFGEDSLRRFDDLCSFFHISTLENMQ